MPMAFVPDEELEPHRRAVYDGLELASDSVERADASDFVVGVGPAPEWLARLTSRRPVRSALDLGTGPGTHALLASRHTKRVVGVDINPRALAFAAMNARLNGIENVEWRLGSWLEPVAGERFDLVVANPPYVVSPDQSYVYRDSGEPGDALVRRLLGEIPAHLEEDGYAFVLCNWLPRPDSWRAPLDEVIAGTQCDAVILMYENDEPEEYARAWNRLIANRDHLEFEAALERWLAHYRERGIESIAFGVVVLRRRTGDRNWARALKVPASPTMRAGEHVDRLFTGWDRVLRGDVDGVRLLPGSRLLRRVSLDDRSERISLEVRPNAGFAARVEPAVAKALAAGEPIPADERKRLVGLGLLTPS